MNFLNYSTVIQNSTSGLEKFLMKAIYIIQKVLPLKQLWQKLRYYALEKCLKVTQKIAK